MLTADRISTLIEADKITDKKKQAEIGDKYYRGQHDILGKRIFFINADGDLQEDLTKSNIRKPHPFFMEMSDQLVQYLMSNEEGVIRSDVPELQKELDARMNDNEDYQLHLREMLTGVVTKGFEYAYCYKNTDGRSVFECADSLGVVEVREEETDDHCAYVIYWMVDRVDAEGRTIKRIQVWDEHNVQFFVQVGDGEIELDESEPINPRPHIVYKRNKGKENEKLYHSGGYGFIPFHRFENNRWQMSDLNPIKPLIDNYDLMSCGLSNNIEDTNEALYVVSGFEGDNLDELMMNIKAKKHIGVGENGKVEIQTIDIPVEARKTMMEIDETNIYRFGMSLNLRALRDTSATTNVAIKSAYSLLDLKSEKLKPRLKSFMRWEIGIVLDEINQEKGTSYTQGDVYFAFKAEIPTNAKENAEIELFNAQRRQFEVTTILNVATRFGNEQVTKMLCDQFEIDYMDLKDKLPKEDETLITSTEAMSTLDAEPTVGVSSGE